MTRRAPARKAGRPAKPSRGGGAWPVFFRSLKPAAPPAPTEQDQDPEESE